MEHIGKVPWGIQFYTQEFSSGCLLALPFDNENVACAIYLGYESLDEEILVNLAEKIFSSRMKHIHIIGKQAEEFLHFINRVSLDRGQELYLGQDSMQIYNRDTIDEVGEIVTRLSGSDYITVLAPNADLCQKIYSAVQQKIDDEIELYQNEWRQLGFFYDLDTDRNQWVFTGSLDGLLKFRDLLLEYVANPRHARLSEHDHYGTYLVSYLKVMTWHQPGINADSIHGRIADLERLAGLIESRIGNSSPQTVIRIDSEYVQDCDFSLVFKVMEAEFDPASMDPLLKKS